MRSAQCIRSSFPSTIKNCTSIYIGETGPKMCVSIGREHRFCHFSSISAASDTLRLVSFVHHLMIYPYLLLYPYSILHTTLPFGPRKHYFALHPPTTSKREEPYSFQEREGSVRSPTSAHNSTPKKGSGAKRFQFEYAKFVLIYKID